MLVKDVNKFMTHVLIIKIILRLKMITKAIFRGVIREAKAIW